MAVKIRLRRMGAKKAPFYRIVLIQDIQETDVSSKSWATMTQLRNLLYSRLTTKRQSLGSLTVHSQLIQLRLFSRRTALSNS